MELKGKVEFTLLCITDAVGSQVPWTSPMLVNYQMLSLACLLKLESAIPVALLSLDSAKVNFNIIVVLPT